MILNNPFHPLYCLTMLRLRPQRISSQVIYERHRDRLNQRGHAVVSNKNNAYVAKSTLFVKKTWCGALVCHSIVCSVDIPFRHCLVHCLHSMKEAQTHTTMLNPTLHPRVYQNSKTFLHTRNRTNPTPEANMKLQATLFLLTLGTVIPTVSAAVFNEQLKVWDIGHVDTETSSSSKHKTWPAQVMGPCGGIPEGGYACGSFEDKGVMALRAIYRCDRGVLRNVNTCWESDKRNRCVKNGRRKGKKFLALAMVDRIICETKNNVEKP
jgi:hypothetical protein